MSQKQGSARQAEAKEKGGPGGDAPSLLPLSFASFALPDTRRRRACCLTRLAPPDALESLIAAAVEALGNRGCAD